MLHPPASQFHAAEEPLWHQIDKLVSSDVLHGSESLCKLLRYLARHALHEPGVRLKEYQIATEVFGRPADFDPQSDSMIRVQAGRLRAKIAEYYASVGALDPIVVELPKGSYQLQFHHRESQGRGRHPVALVGTRSTGARSSGQAWKIASAALAVLLIGVLIALAWVLMRGSVQAVVVESKAVPPEFQALWKPFIRSPEGPWLIFSNAAFVGRPETGMRYYNSGKDGETQVWDHYTGVGEVLAVHDLDEVFHTLQRQFRVKRGSLFSLDDVRNNDLIFVGSPSENLTLAEIPTTREFIFQRMDDGARKGDLAVVNVHPRPGESRIFLASPYGSPLTEDYAVIALMPGLDPARSVILFAGTTTFGTQAAVEYVSRGDSLKELLARLPSSKNGEIKPFEALLHVKIAHGVPVTEELIALRP